MPFTWIPFYEAFATRMLEFRDRQGELRDALEALRAKELPATPIAPDRIATGQIDPFSVFSSFNRQISDENRKKIAAELGRLLDVRVAPPSDFKGVPVADNHHSIFAPWPHQDGDRAVGLLWDMLSACVRGFDEEVPGLFDATLQIHGVGLSKLTSALFWCRPKRFLSLDRNTCAYLSTRGVAVPRNIDGEAYLALIERVRATLGDDFPQISADAYVPAPPDREDERDVVDTQPPARVLFVRADQGSKYAPEFRDLGLVAIGFEEALGKEALGATWDDLKAAMQAAHAYRSIHTTSNWAGSLERFLRLKPGDWVCTWVPQDREYLVGQATSKVRWAPGEVGDLPYVASAKWRFKVPKAALPKDVRGGLGAAQSTFLLSTHVVSALWRVAGLDGAQPAPSPARSWPPLAREWQLAVTPNVVLEGVPGTGKTFAIKRLASDAHEQATSIFRGDGSGRFAITLHPATSYEDFVEGLRPGSALTLGDEPWFEHRRVDGGLPALRPPVSGAADAAGPWFFEAPSTHEVVEVDTDTDDGQPAGAATRFAIHDGFFLRVCREALFFPNRAFLVLLDEINRCNVPKVMGDLLTTLEAAKRARWDSKSRHWDVTGCQLVTLPYSKRRFFVPDNVFVVATMNTTDRSVAPLDAALRRRFAFRRLEPVGWRPEDVVGGGNDRQVAVEGWLNDLPGVTSETAESMALSVKAWVAVNHELRLALGADGMLGHSYLVAMANEIAATAAAAARWPDSGFVAQSAVEIQQRYWEQQLLPQVFDLLASHNRLELLRSSEGGIGAAVDAVADVEVSGTGYGARPAIRAWRLFSGATGDTSG